MNDKLNHPFQPGVEVAVVSYGKWDKSVSFKKATVAKVHKTGKFTLDGSRDQWGARRDWLTKEWQASLSGYGDGRSVQFITPKLLADVAESDMRSEFVGLRNKIASAKGPASEPILTLMRDLCAALKAANKEATK